MSRESEVALYQVASDIAAIAMGPRAVGDDPLAWWELTTLLINFRKASAAMIQKKAERLCESQSRRRRKT